ncbi:MAG TPA: hypothetical protein VIO94_15780 [Phenylobacterium sp.]
MDKAEQIARFIHGMILTDDYSNAWPIGASEQSGDTYSFTLGIDPDGGPGEALVKIAITVSEPTPTQGAE